MSLIPDQLEAIEHLKDLIEDARNRKKGIEENSVEARFGKRERGRGHVTLSGRTVDVFGSGQFTNFGASDNKQGGFDKGGAVGDLNAALRSGALKLKPSGDPVGDRLRRKVGALRLKCQLAQIRGNKAYYRCIAKNHGKGACDGLRVTVECPDARSAEQELAAYMAGKNVNTIEDARSGGGGGGGF